MVEKHFSRDLEKYQEKIKKYLEICAHYYRLNGNITETAAASGVSRDLVYRVTKELMDEENAALLVDLKPIKITQKYDTEKNGQTTQKDQKVTD